MKRRSLLATTIAATLVGSAEIAYGQAYPSGPVKLVVGFSAGGPADTLSRIVAQKLSQELKQPVVIDNRPGAGGTIAAGAVANSSPDGLTLLFVSSGHAGNATLYKKLPYDTLKDFVSVGSVAATPVVIIINSESAYKTLEDLVNDARQNPGKLNFAAGGGGATLTSLAAGIFKNETKIDAVQVPYKGTAPALTGLLGGEVDFAFDTVSGSIGFIKSGKMRALAVTSQQRSSVIPDVPTVAEEMLPGFDVTGWFGIVAPAGTPAPILDQLNRALNHVLADAEVKTRLADLGSDPLGGSADEFGKLIASETARWGEIINRLDLKAE